MISAHDILITQKVRKNLNSDDIKLDEINYKNLNSSLKNENIALKLHSFKDWSNFKRSKTYSILLHNIEELYRLGYGNKFASLCLSIKYKIFISHQIINRRIGGCKKFRLSYSINEAVFEKSDIIVNGRISYSKLPNSIYLYFKCAKIRDLAKGQRIGVKIFYGDNDKIFLERDDRSAKKLIIHSDELVISLYPVPIKLDKFLRNTDKTYKSCSVSVHFNSQNLGFKREELIDDNSARILYPELRKFGFVLPKERITNMSRSRGDLVVVKRGEKMAIEITNLGGTISSKYKWVRNHNYRDALIGKIIRMVTSNDCMFVFVLNDTLKVSIINDDFKSVINKYGIKIIFTDFKKGWEIDVAKNINTLFRIPTSIS